MIIVLLATSKYGIGMFPDSVKYISAARNLLIGVGLVTFDGHPMTLHAPFYPLILSLFSFITALDPVIASVYLNGFLMAGIVFSAGMY